MHKKMEKRCKEISQYVVKNGASVRETAKIFKLSKSTVYRDITERVAKVDEKLAGEVKKVLLLKKSERHVRGWVANIE